MINPRVRFCWACSNRLRGNHYTELDVHGEKRILHKFCARKLQKKQEVHDRIIQKFINHSETLDW